MVRNAHDASKLLGERERTIVNIPKDRLQFVGKFLFVTLAYFITAKLGLHFAVVQPNATAVWAPTGIAIAAFLLLDYRFVPAIFLAAFFANLTTGGTTFGAAFGIATGNTLEAFTAAYLINRFAQGVHAFEHVANVFKFFLFAGIAGPAVSATFGVTSLAFAHLLPWVEFQQTWFTWFLGDLGGATIVAPFLILWFTDRPAAWSKRQMWEAFALVTLLVFFGVFILQNRTGFVYLMFPLLVWEAFRFDPLEVSASVLLMGEILFWNTLQGSGPFVAQSGGSINDAFILLIATMAPISVTMLALGAKMAEIRKLRITVAEREVMNDAMFAIVGDGLILVNKDGKVVLANPQAEAMLGFSSGEIMGKDYAEVIRLEREDGKPVPRDERPFMQALARGERVVSNPFMQTEYYVRQDGSRFPISYTKTPILIQGEIVGLINIFHDATKKTREENTVDLISLASHQLKTPLSIIGLSTELLQGQGKLFGKYNEEDIGSYTKDIQDATRQMVEIINDLGHVSRIEAGSIVPEPENVRVPELVSHVIDELAAKIKRRRLHISVRSMPNQDLFRTDRLLLKIILQNLMSNAVKYTPDEGTVLVSTTREGKYLVIVVGDTGYGVPQAEQPRIFNKFFRATNVARVESEGSGLGLYITKSLAHLLKGEVSFASAEGQGTTFVVRIPEAEAPLSELA